MCKVSQRKVVFVNKTLAAQSEFDANINIPFIVDEIAINSKYVGHTNAVPYVIKSDLVKDEVFLVGGTNVISNVYGINDRFTINDSINGTYKFTFFTPAETPTRLPITGDIVLKLEFIRY